MSSRAWFARRARWFDRAVARGPVVCAVCGAPWAPEDGDLHHATYDRLGHEADEDLVPLCRADHEALHTLWDASPAWRRIPRAAATAGMITALRAGRPEQAGTPPRVSHEPRTDR